MADDLRATIAQIKQLTDLREIIPDLKKSGSASLCVCPFHPDKNPSMSVNKEFFHCFGCGVSGDIITWFEKTNRIDWNAALQMAGGWAGVDIGDDLNEAIARTTKERDEREEELYNYRQALEEEKAPQKYLADRGIKPETIEHFRLGYRRDWKAIAIPIYGRSGRLDAISYRYLDPNNQQRYHHKNNELWVKGDALYNAASIDEAGAFVCVCEGMFDAITIHQAGFRRVVATMGSSLSDAHIRELGDAPILLVPDCKSENDFNIFRRAVLRLKQTHPDLSVRVALLPEGDANSQGEDVVKETIQKAQSAEYAILQHDLERCTEREQEYRAARKLCADIKDVLVKDDIVVWLSQRWEKDRATVKAALDRSDEGTTQIMTVREAFREMIEEEKLAASSGLGMGWPSIRRYIDRPHSKQTCIFAARTSVGKTMWALNLLHKTKEDGVPTLFVSQEQPAGELMARLILMATSEHGIGEWGKEDLHKAILANDSKLIYMQEYMPIAYPNLVFTTKALTPQELNDAIIDASTALGQNIKEVMVDYVGLMKHAGGSRLQRYDRVSLVMTESQEVIKERSVLGLFLAQVGRDKGGDGTDPIDLDSIRDSGVTEEVGDYVITAWKDKQQMQYEAETGIRKLCGRVCKNRHGETGDFTMWMNKRTLVLHDEDRQNRGPVVRPARKDFVDLDEDGVVL